MCFRTKLPPKQTVTQGEYMNLSICTISFRHQLISMEQIVSWAQHNHFQGIELWGIHAKNLSDQPNYNKNWLNSYGLTATMISDYLPLAISEKDIFYKVQLLIRLAKHWGAKKIRTFAGEKGSADTSNHERRELVQRLKLVCSWLAQHDMQLIIETHPNTFADSVASTELLFSEVNHDNLKLNFDVLHVWESKANVINALERLRPHINHFHLKNISSADFLHVFNPPNVYSASGSREGMTPLFEGAVNFKEFIEYLHDHSDPELATIDASLEWFGHNCKNTLMRDRYLVQQLKQQELKTA